MKNVVSAFTAPFRFIRNKIFFFIFLNGFLLALLIYFFTEDNYENQIFKALATQVKQSTTSIETDSLLLQSLHLTYNLEKFRLSVFGDKQIRSIKSDLIRPVTYDLMTGSGACGSYAFVLCRLLNELNVETRFAQMKVNGEFGGHIIVEAKSNYGWVVLDPSYDLSFKKTTGQLANFEEVKSNWASFKNQVPDNYNPDYSYSDAQYSNWNKIPVIMPLVKGVLSVVKGKKAANEISIRNIILRKFSLLFNITLVFYILITLLFIKTYIRQSEEIENFRVSLLFPKKKSEPLTSQAAA